MTKAKKAGKLLLRTLFVAAFWILIWCLLAKKIGNDFLFPSLSVTLEALRSLTVQKAFWLTTSVSLLRVLWGILVSWILGSLLAYLLHVSSLFRSLLSPILTAVKSTPVASFIILALLWMERSVLPVLITALIVIPVVCANVSEGIQSVDQGLLEVTKVYGFSMKKRVMKLYIPSIAPYFMAACKSSLGMAWKAGIAAEILSTPRHAIGTELYFSKTYLETPTLFAWTLVVILLSLIIEKLLVYGLKKLGNHWHLLPKGERHAEAE